MKPQVLETLVKGVDDLKAKKIEKNALEIGDKMPSFILPNVSGNEISSDKLLEKGPIVISFYRGGWCPYCNLELRALQDLLPDFDKYNATLVAISPEKPDNSLSTQEKNNLTFRFLAIAIMKLQGVWVSYLMCPKKLLTFQKANSIWI